MDFITIRQLEAQSAEVWRKIEAGEEIVVTRDGKAFALLVPIEPYEIEELLRGLRTARFESALREMQRIARERGNDKLTLEDIDTEIAAARRERRE